MIDIKEIYNNPANQSRVKDLSEQLIINSTNITSKDIIAVFKRDITNIIIYFLLLIPVASVILTSKNINAQSITLCVIIFLASIYITVKELQIIRKIKTTNKTKSAHDVGFNDFTAIPHVIKYLEFSRKSRRSPQINSA